MAEWSEAWTLKRYAVVGLLVLLVAVFLVDAFGPPDFQAGGYVAPILIALGGLFADTIIKPRMNGNGNGNGALPPAKREDA